MAKKKSGKTTVMVKPSKLPKDASTTVRFNKFIRDRLKELGFSIQQVLDEGIDKKLGKVEYEKKTTIETKK